MKQRNPAKPEADKDGIARLFNFLFGGLLGLSILKFGNVAIFESLVAYPENGWEWVLNPWPVAIGYVLLLVMAVAGVTITRWQIRTPKWLLLMPLAWLLWQFVAATQSVDSTLSRATLKHFASCILCFYIGYFVVGQRQNPMSLLTGMIIAVALVVATGLEQHFGGLERTRHYFYTYLYPQMTSVPPEYLKKMNSDRIWGTLFYPNSLAGVMLLLLPAVLAACLQRFTRLTLGARQFVAAAFAAGGLACLYWSGSKGGWLLMLLLGLITLVHLPFGRRWKVLVVASVLVVGLAGFGLKYAGFFRRGATSVSARFDYWSAAAKTALRNPIFGTGPGTFALSYEKIKRPESEMAKLTHNDYLQQASDSGLLGMGTFSAFVLGIVSLGRPRPDSAVNDWLAFAIWLGLVGWWLQGFLEFGLYIPALAWPGFGLSGWLLANRGKPIDKVGLTI